MTISTTYTPGATAQTQAKPQAQAQTQAQTGLGSLGQGDFLRLMTVQMQHQDPFDPVDQKEMLAQMAQFSSLAGISEMNQTLGGIAEVNANLKEIAAKLDAALAARQAEAPVAGEDAANPASNGEPVLPQE